MQIITMQASTFLFLKYLKNLGLFAPGADIFFQYPNIKSIPIAKTEISTLPATIKGILFVVIPL